MNVHENYELISAYQVLVREDIKSILSNGELSDETINSVLKRYSENPDKLKDSINSHGLLSRDSCGKQHTIHGLLIESLISMKFLPFENYLPMVESTVLKDDDDLPGIKETVLEYKEPIDDLVREIEQIDNKCGRFKEVAKIILNTFKNGENIKNVSKLQRDYIIEYVRNKCRGVNKNYVIDAPTGSGKTLIFAFMALFEALLGNRVFIIYPRKQLAEDQANKFIRYVYYVRDELIG
jgi:CRISPR/Cas system-associated endonuclease/helicase Cas3